MCDDGTADRAWIPAAQDYIVRESRDRKSAAVAEVSAGDQVRFGAMKIEKSGVWMEAALPDGKNGFVWMGPAPRTTGPMILLVLGLIAIIGGIVAYNYSQRPSPTPSGVTETIVLRNGTTEYLKASAAFTFWKTVIPSDIYPQPDAEFAILSDEQEKELLASAVIKAPSGVIVRPYSLVLTTEPRQIEFQLGKKPVQRAFQVKYREYVLKGEWEVTVPKDFPAGELLVEIAIEAIPTLKKQLNALHPTRPVSLWLRFETKP